jgi:unsaturated chondroitin disaccharide hydrolase
MDAVRAVLGAALAALALAAPAAAAPSEADLARVTDLAAQRLAAADARLAQGQFPEITVSGQWRTLDASAWTSGFFPGALWLQFEATGDARWREAAKRRQAPLEPQKGSRTTHDLGFMLLDSFGHDLRLTGDPKAREVVVEAARSLASRWSPAVGMTRSWDTPSDFTVIVDNLMNLELLFVAARSGGDPAWREMAHRHALRSRAEHLRADGSTFHLVDFDEATGQVARKRTHQGHAADSTWSRGLAWAIYGFAVAHRETRDPLLLEAAERAARYFLANLPADRVPFWDFAAPGIPDEPRDSSAAAIAASGLLELAGLAADGRSYRAGAEEILGSLVSDAYLAVAQPTEALLLHGTQSKPHNQADRGLIYGDYFLLEAVLRLRRARAADAAASASPPGAGPTPTSPGAGPAGSPGSTAVRAPGRRPAGTLAVRAVRPRSLRALLARGLAADVVAPAAGTLRARLSLGGRTVAATRLAVRSHGPRRVRLRVRSPTWRVRLARLRVARVTLTVEHRDAAGTRLIGRATLRLRR